MNPFGPGPFGYDILDHASPMELLALAGFSMACVVAYQLGKWLYKRYIG